MKSIGILGGGQLSRLLSLRAKTQGIPVFVLSPSKKDPAAQQNPLWIKGDPKKQKDLKKFFQLVDIISFESDFISANKIQKALQSLGNNKPHIAPSLKNLSLIQDRYTQKKLLSQYKITTADFIKLTLNISIQKKLLSLLEKWGPFVLKTRKGGYDGYGTFQIKRKSQIKKLALSSHSFIAEKFIPFKRELAFLAARNKKGQVIFFPLVESFQKNSKCLWVKGPVLHKKFPALKQKVKKFLNGISYEGLIAFELFDIGERLIVNELAPRVHNSGHYSLDALSEDQFITHLKAIRNNSLSPPKKFQKGFAMLNLLGEGYKKPKLKTKKGISVWWYGKTISHKGRKMGHINTTNRSAPKALETLLKHRSSFKV